MLPFDLLDYEKPQRLDRALGVEPKWNAWVEVHNLIASAESIHDYGPADVLRIGRKHGVDFRRSFASRRRGLYRDYLDYCLDRGDLSTDDRDILVHLAHTLQIDADDVQPIHQRAFGRTVSDALADNEVGIEDRLLLYKLQYTLGLDPGHAEATYEKLAREKLLKSIAHVVADGMLSPDERKEIEILQKEFDVDVPARVDTLLDEAATTYSIHSGPLPRIDVGVKLDSGELGHFQTRCQWKRLNYAHLRVQLSAHRAWLMRGETELLRVPPKALSGRRSEGWVAVTNRHLILITKRRDLISYRLASLGDVERYSNGIRVALPDDRSLYLNAGRANRALFSVLFRLLNPGEEPRG